MSDLLEWLAHLDIISRIEGVVSTFLNADWRGAARRGGMQGLLRELGASLTASNTWTLYVPRNCGWRGIDIERLLRRHGVKIWGRGFTNEYLTFRVKRRQANWAEYLLWRRGIPVYSHPFNPRNRLYAERHAPGSEPPLRGRRSTSPGLLDRFRSLFS